MTHNGNCFVPYGVSYGTLKYHFIELLFWLYNSICKFTGPIMGFVFVPYGVSYGTLNYHFIELLFWLYNSIYKFTGPIMGFFLFHMGLAMCPVNTHFSCTHYGTFDKLWCLYYLAVILCGYVEIDEQDIAKPIAELLVCITSLNINREVQNWSKIIF